MPRVVSLYLPDFATDRIRRREAGRTVSPPPEGAVQVVAAEKAVARGGGWRPGARWSQEHAGGVCDDPWLERRLAKRARKMALKAEIDRMPAHQRPPMRELGRRSEAAPMPFRAMPPDEGGPVLAFVPPAEILPPALQRKDADAPPRRDPSSPEAARRALPSIASIARLDPGLAAARDTRASRIAAGDRQAPTSDAGGKVLPFPPSPRTRSGVHPEAGGGAEGRRTACGDRWTPEQVGIDPAQISVPPRRRPGSSGDVPEEAGPSLAIDGSILDPGLRRGGARSAGFSPGQRLGDGCVSSTQADRLSAPHYLAPAPDRSAGLPVARNHGFPPRHDFDGAPAGTSRKTVAPAGYDLEGAFWEQGAAVGRAMAREAGREPAASPEPVAETGHAPLVTAMREKQRVVVAAACPAARARGIVPGMAMTQARMMVPGLDVRDADPVGEAADLARLAHHAARHWTPLAMPVEGRALWLDITASAHLFGGEARLVRRILGFCRRLGLTARAAVADTPAAAHALAASGAGAMILSPPGEDAGAVAPLPPGLLRLPDKIVEAVRRLGIDSIGALAAMPRAPLVRRFGAVVGLRLDQIAGVRAEPIDPVVPATAPSVERRFFEPVMTVAGLTHALGGLAEGLVAKLATEGRGARMLVLRLVRIDNHAQTIAIGLARPSRDAGHMARLLHMRIEEIEPGFGIEAATLTAVRADVLEAEAIAGVLSGRTPADDLAVLVDRLATRLGERRLYRVGMVESEVPERGLVRHPPLVLPPGWVDPWPRPTRLLDPPERVHEVIALLPDQPPRRFTWRGRRHSVTRGDGPERLFGEWWRRVAERDAVRDYFRVEDEAGQRFWLFRRGDGVDGVTGDLSWHVHGVFG